MLIDIFDRFNDRLPDTSMTNHVSVGEVEDDELVSQLDAVKDGFGDSGGAHLWMGGELIGFEGRDKVKFLSRAFGFAAAVEEIGDVGVFFRFGDVDLGDLVVGENIGEGVIYRRWRKCNGHRKGFFVRGHSNSHEIFRVIGAFEFVEGGEAEGFGDLASSVFTEVGDDDGVVVFESDWLLIGLDDLGRRDIFVIETLGVEVLDSLVGVGEDVFGFAG